MAEKILLVDDDNNILDGYRRSLGREFLMETALGGEQALKQVWKGAVPRVGARIVAHHRDRHRIGTDGVQTGDQHARLHRCECRESTGLRRRRWFRRHR